MQHKRCSTLFGRRQRSKQALTALSTSGSVAKYRLCVARRRVSFQTRSIGASCGLYGGRNNSFRFRSVAAQKWGQDRVMIPSVVQYQHHAPSACLLRSRRLRKLWKVTALKIVHIMRTN